MAKSKMPRVTEPDAGLVHYGPAPLADAVTLCGLTDWIGHKQAGKETKVAVTCNLCKSIKEFCDAHDA